MPTVHKLNTSPLSRDRSPHRLDTLRVIWDRLTHQGGMSTEPDVPGPDEDRIITLAELADWLGVPLQTLYDLRAHGRGPRAFRIGRELRVRRSEALRWMASLETEDADRREQAPT